MRRPYERPQIVQVDAGTTDAVRSVAQDNMSCPGGSTTTSSPPGPRAGEDGKRE